MRVFVLAGALLLLSGCLTPCPPPQSGSSPALFRCGDGSSLDVVFSYGPNAAQIVQEGYATLTLPARSAGSGYRYAGRGAELRGRGTQVRWVRPGAAETICHQQRS